MVFTQCDFLHCDAEQPLIVVYAFEGRQWGLCALHERIIEANGASVEYEGGKAYLFSPVMARGKPD